MIDFYQIRSPLSQITEERMYRFINSLSDTLGEELRKVSLEDYLADEFALLYVASGTHMYDLSNGGVDLAPTRDHIPADVLAVVEQAKADIIAGKITVPTLAEEVPEFTLAG